MSRVIGSSQFSTSQSSSPLFSKMRSLREMYLSMVPWRFRWSSEMFSTALTAGWNLEEVSIMKEEISQTVTSPGRIWETAPL